MIVLWLDSIIPILEMTGVYLTFYLIFPKNAKLGAFNSVASL